MGTAAEQQLDAALVAHRSGHALSREFHTDPAIHALELDRVWRRSWLFAGPSAVAPTYGDFFRFDLGDDSIVVVRLADGSLGAFHNTCRHRGMPVCAERSGTAQRWVCPYHQWSYDLEGRLLGAGGTERELDLSDLDLISVPVSEVGGLIFV
jgi:phenylpropionate dioxygenase-like ring-hydroxylating dioxygenase large terminal subunit